MLKLSARLADCAAVQPDPPTNNFSLLRIVAALGVVLGHSIILSGNLDSAMGWRLGYLAVNGFFIISGFLICRSLLTRNNPRHYIVARLLRIFPALIVVVLITVLIAGPVLTALSMVDYFQHPMTWRHALNNSLLVVGDIALYLPGLFQNNPLPQQVNAPLWTLQYELLMYAGLLALFSLTLLSRRLGFHGPSQRLFHRLVLLITVIAMVLYLGNITRTSPEVSQLANMLRFTAMFGAGASCYLLREKITLSVTVFVAILVLAGICLPFRPAFIVVTYLSAAYLLLCLAYLPGGWLGYYNKIGDYSYGTYIIAFPVQQTLMHYFPGLGWAGLFCCTVLITLPLAMLSWHWIERPALALKPATDRRVKQQ